MVAKDNITFKPTLNKSIYLKYLQRKIAVENYHTIIVNIFYYFLYLNKEQI